MKKWKIPYLNVLPVLLIAFLLFRLINNTELSIGGLFETVYGSVAYFVAGLVVAYILNPAMVFFERLISSKKDSARVKKTKRAGIIAFLYLLFIGIVTVFVVAVIPTIRTGIREISDNMPYYAKVLERFLTDFSLADKAGLSGTIKTWINEGSGFLFDWLQGLDFSTIGGAVSSGVSSFATGVVRLGFGLVISVYFLYSKERLLLNLKKLMYALFGRRRTDAICEKGAKINSIFLDYITSRLLQSLIMFLLGLAVLVPLGVPLAPLLAIFMAVCNLIPYFGPFLGGLISVVLVLFYSPVKAFWVLAYAIGIQMLDNMVIGPKIMSDQVGISPILVIAGVTLGGTIGGVLGMILGVPAVAVVKLVFYDPYIERKLKEREIDV